MRHMLLIYTDESTDIAYGTPEWDQLMVEYGAFSAEVRRRGVMVHGDPLQSVQTATTLRLVNGQVALLDGPFAETREQLGGFYILDTRDTAEAVELAAMIPSAKRGSIEVRRMAGHEQRVLQPPTRLHYMVLLYGSEAHYYPPEDPRVKEGIAAHQRFTAERIAHDEFVTGDALALTSSAVTVRVREGRTLCTDGPFAETREHLGGFYILNVSDLDRAITLARELGPQPNGCIEVRPIQEV